ncbi:early nodulin-like protein 2 [Ricinus communis]|uniref:Copper ion binding protein, putative n=1 Tax=Ricinus communis TaxID=3988 RepID=B9SQI2_RICCO|nr:early nodulin-like protein 2 [Ricinus communis]EEF34136.1 copper ion binding protein, putative [Ricinus communis]|eukprot:XP_002528251.1 early nodulin-like protein 2 [Ricinus communis]
MIMASKVSTSLCLALFACFFITSSFGYTFYVGGKDGWVLNPPEDYNDWAGRNRFSVNDTLVFKYKNGSDSVLVVSKDDYYSCNTKNPIKNLNSGTSVFQFDRSGPFFFITGNEENCQKGQRLIVVVLAIRPKPTKESPKSSPAPTVSSPPPAIPPESSAHSPSSPSPKSPSPIAKPPSSSAHVPAVSPASPSPIAKAPSSSAHVPAVSPASPSPFVEAPSLAPTPALSPKSPKAKTPSFAPSPFTTSPTSSPTKAPSPSAVAHAPISPSPSPAAVEEPVSSPSPVAVEEPVSSPSPAATSPSPVATTTSPSSSPTPSATEPANSPESGSGSEPVSSPDSGNSADVNAPAPRRSASLSLTPTITVYLLVSLILGASLSGV